MLSEDAETPPMYVSTERCLCGGLAGFVGADVGCVAAGSGLLVEVGGEGVAEDVAGAAGVVVFAGPQEVVAVGPGAGEGAGLGVDADVAADVEVGAGVDGGGWGEADLSAGWRERVVVDVEEAGEGDAG